MNDRGASSRSNRWGRGIGILLIALLLSLFCGALVVFLPFRSLDGVSAQSIPVAMHSVLQADYSADPVHYVVAAVDLGLVDQVIQDAEVEQAAEERIDEIFDNLITPVGGLATANPPGQVTATQPGAVNPTRFVPTQNRTQAPSLTSAPTSTTIVSATNTLAAATSTRTSLPPTRTSVPPTRTSIPPTRTSAPPANTPVPPTAVPATPVPPTQPAYPPPVQPTDPPVVVETPVVTEPPPSYP
ncbi:MAG TPA: hypothetical protein VHO48_09600 [Anaerolineaceae bacterium]|nr:hypothetical protein [Anaerolineaceae bacterium]